MIDCIIYLYCFERMKKMTKLFSDKKTEISVCAIFTMLLAMCMVGSYYLQYSSDIYWVKSFSYVLLLLFSLYVFVFSMLNKEKNEKFASLGLLIATVFALTENVMGLLSRADLRVAFEAIALAFKAFVVFTLLDVLVFKTNLLKKWWYYLIGLVLLLVPAMFKALPMISAYLSSVITADQIKLFTCIFNIVVSVFALTALVISVIAIIKKVQPFSCWSALIYNISVLLYGIFGLLRALGINAEQATRNTAIAFELGTVLLLLAIINLNKPVEKKSNKKHK